jgi:hypothetical protein
MTTYTAFFRTAAEYAMHDFEANSPEHALRMARAFFDDHDEDLMFEAYDGGLPLDEIEIAGPEGHAPAVWHSDDLRLRLAAPGMLKALQMAANFIGDDLSDDSTENRIYTTLNEAIAKAHGATPPAPAIEGDMNTKRAAWASAALVSFCAITGQNTEEEVEEAMGDLLCDLLHLAQAKGFDPQAMLTRAVGHYEHEILYPDDERMTGKRV